MKISFPLGIYLAAAVLRLVPVLLARDLGIGLDDMFQYDMLARSLAAGDGYRWYARDDLRLLEPYIDFDWSTAPDYDPESGLATSFRAPLYPAFLALVYSAFGSGTSRFFAARLIQALALGAPLAPLTYALSRRIFPSLEGSARIAAAIVAAYPILLLYPLGLGTENPFILLLLLSLLSLHRCLDRPDWPTLLTAGILLGLTALTRSVILLFAGLAFAHLLVRHRRRALVALAGFLTVVTPWIARNTLLHHRLTGIETSMGYNLYLGYHPRGDGSFVFGPSLDLLVILDDAVRDSEGTQRALEFIRSRPVRVLPLAVNRLGFFFGLEKRVLVYLYSNNLVGPLPQAWLLVGAVLLLAPFICVSLAACFALPKLVGNPASGLLLMLLIGYLLPHVLILSEDRFHLAWIPVLAVLAPVGWQSLRDRPRLPEPGYRLLPGSWVLACLLVINWIFELVRDYPKLALILGPDGHRTFLPY